VTVPVIAFFNNKGGVGKTSLVYHLAWMYSDLGFTVLATDLDSQANLTSAFIDDVSLEALWSRQEHATIAAALAPLFEGTGDVTDPRVHRVSERLYLGVGSLALSRFEDDLSGAWAKCNDRDERSFRVTSAFWRVLQRGASACGASVALIDLGPSLGALNRAALVASDHVVVPLGADLFSLQGLTNLGPRLREWRDQWTERRGKSPSPSLALPPGTMQPAGYVVLQHAVRDSRTVKAYQRWMERIPDTYAQHVLGGETQAKIPAEDSSCLGELRHYRSLVPMAQEARKPIFHLRSADGAIGSHAVAVQQSLRDFQALAAAIAKRTWRPGFDVPL
jgi:chromosome partitioning protein